MFTAFSQGFTSLRRHPWLFLLLIAAEAIFFTFLALLLYSFAATFMSSLQAMDAFLLAQPWMTADPSQQNLADLNIPATDLSVMQLHNAAISHAALALVLWGGALFVFSRALSYALSSSIAVREPSRGLAVRLGTSLLVAAVFVAAMMYLGWTVIVGLVGNFFSPEGSAAPLYILPLLGLLALGPLAWLGRATSRRPRCSATRGAGSWPCSTCSPSRFPCARRIRLRESPLPCSASASSPFSG